MHPFHVRHCKVLRLKTFRPYTPHPLHPALSTHFPASCISHSPHSASFVLCSSCTLYSVPSSTKLWKGNVFSNVCLFTWEVPMWPLPWCHWAIKDHMGIPADMFKLVHLRNCPSPSSGLPTLLLGPDPPNMSKPVYLGTLKPQSQPSWTCSHLFTMYCHSASWALDVRKTRRIMTEPQLA